MSAALLAPLLLAQAPPPPAPLVPLQVTVTLYGGPNEHWSRLAKTAKAHPNVPHRAIISTVELDKAQGIPKDTPQSGDRIEAVIAHNKTWLDAMDELRSAGVTVLHYLHMRNLTCGAEVSCGCGVDPLCCVVEGVCVRKYRCCNSYENVSSIVNSTLTYFPDDGIFTDVRRSQPLPRAFTTGPRASRASRASQHAAPGMAPPRASRAHSTTCVSRRAERPV